jgi:outer membrane protein OmpA-like peptidoglycan-associated protein
MQERLQSARQTDPLASLAAGGERLAAPNVVLIASLATLTLFIAMGVLRQAPLIEQDISDRARDAFTAAGIGWAQLVVDGRDLTLVGVAPSAAARGTAYRLAARLDGVRLVRNRTTLRTGRPEIPQPPPAPPPPMDLVLRSDGAHLTLIGDVPDDDNTARLVVEARKRFAVADVSDELKRERRNAPDAWPAAADAALQALVLLEHGEARLDGTELALDGVAADAGLRARTRQTLLQLPAPFTAATNIAIATKGKANPLACQADIAALLSAARIEFDGGSAQLRADSTPVLEELVAIMQRCSSLRFEIAGHTDDRGDAQANLSLSQRRAEAVMEYLVQHDVPLRRLAARGYGEQQPLVRATTDAARARNRRIEVHADL